MTGKIKMSENKIKYAQDVMGKYSGGRAMGGFNSRIQGQQSSHEFYRNKDFEGASGWKLADDMIREGRLFYVENFHTEGNCCAFPYGGTWACNGCNNDHLDKPWWKIKVFKDGNAWCCIGEDFEDLQTSDNYAFGKTREKAIKNYGDLMGAVSNDT